MRPTADCAAYCLFCRRAPGGALASIVKDRKGRQVPMRCLCAAPVLRAQRRKSRPSSQRDKANRLRGRQYKWARGQFPDSRITSTSRSSFFPAKNSSCALQAAFPRNGVFDKVGFVIWAVNIHDDALRIAVLPTASFQVTRQDGRPCGKIMRGPGIHVQVWHPALKGPPEASPKRG